MFFFPFPNTIKSSFGRHWRIIKRIFFSDAMKTWRKKKSSTLYEWNSVYWREAYVFLCMCVCVCRRNTFLFMLRFCLATFYLCLQMWLYFASVRSRSFTVHKISTRYFLLSVLVSWCFWHKRKCVNIVAVQYPICMYTYMCTYIYIYTYPMYKILLVTNADIKKKIK